jgi:hypothetical protein
MKTGNCLFVFFSVVALLAGCTREKTSPDITGTEKTAPGNNSSKTDHQSKLAENHLITERFTDNAGSGDATEPGNEAAEENIYYQPDTLTLIESIGPAESAPIPERHEPDTIIFVRPSSSAYEQYQMKKGRTSPDVVFIAIFDNDIFDYTDYYYTNGISLQLFHPAIGSSPLARALPGLNGSINFYAISLVQNMYTPLKLEDLQARIGDRPFAAYLSIGHQRVSLSTARHQRLLTELMLGVIGPASGGNIAQDLIHSNTPVGWINQIENDFLVNYSLQFDQGIVHKKCLDLAVSAGGQAGTLYDNLEAGVLFRTGRSNDLYGSLFQISPKEKPFKKRVRYYIGIDMKEKLVLYDATLQGGMFNRESIYTLDADQVKRFVFTGKVLFGLGLGKYSLEAEQVYLSPEFDGGRPHFWFRIKNIIKLN